MLAWSGEGQGRAGMWGKKGQRDQAAMGIRKDEGMKAAVECKIKSDLRQQLGERRIRGFRKSGEKMRTMI